MEDLSREIQEADCDFVRFTWPDIHGIQRARVVGRKDVNDTMKSGIQMYTGTTVFGPRSQLVHIDRCARTCSNMTARPVSGTFHLLPWAGAGKYKVGEVLCESYWPDDTPMEAHSRYVLRRQLDKLQQRGLNIKSGWEFEFMIINPHTEEPLFRGVDFTSNLLFAEQEELLLDIHSLLDNGGVRVEAANNEYGSGQYELSTKPVVGVQGADMAFNLKQGVKEICIHRDLQATFMSKPDVKDSGNGLHYNFSVWRDNDGKNIFYDPDGKNKLSEEAYHWVAGLIYHSRAITAIQCPTVNCYRRLHQPWAPDVASWGIDNRAVCYRVKNYGEEGTYMENRLPSAAANPYLIMAATIAAGLDGVHRKLECPPELDDAAVRVPSTLTEALEALNADQSLVESLGTEFVEWFTAAKKEIEISYTEGFDPKAPNPSAMEKEKYLYHKFI